MTEPASAGWSLTDVSCSQGTVDGATVDGRPRSGDDVTCTYVNKKDATVTVVKDASPERRAGLRVHDDGRWPERLLARR